MSLRIGTRGSALALAQSGWVAAQLGDDVEVVVLRTSGDAGVSGDKTRWVDTIEAALVAGEIDLAVHSAKDVPGDLAEGTAIVGTPVRAAAHDVLVGVLSGVVGTSSLRRCAQLRAVDADIEVVELRGNVDTRLRKLSDGEVDGLVLAAAGIERLGLSVACTALDFVPAPGQGTLAIQGLMGSETLCAAVHDAATFACLMAERAAAQTLGASCHTAVGLHASPDGRMRGFAGRPDGSQWVGDEIDTLDGALLAQRMLAAGAGEVLAA